MGWGHTSRHCVRCGKVGPRVMVLGGWIHDYCRTPAEAAKVRAERRALAKSRGR